MSADQPPDPFATRSTIDPVEDAGTVIGHYRLLQSIGEGGMGEVWLAEQKEPVRRRVALKLVKAGMSTREVMARFESERQALALMDHPAIAKVFDAGSTPLGAPYFVMEYVAGVPITAYCDTHQLSTRERLELFVHVCEGVQHAHQKAIIHRDLKPSNILVTEVDGHPAPKIIDFGVAKALSQRLTADTLYTRVGTLVGTPQYVSPEQALTCGEDIDTRSDVYSLGVIFYELLAGAPPIELHKTTLDEFLRRLREEEPPKPSTKIRTQDAATSTDVARKRHTEPPTLVRQMRGDLDSIALKALEKDRSRRYSSPSDFAADIGRYLRNEAVLAVPSSVAYRAR
jgi:eukaryotic-like serine/threonine-protein kinase